MTLTLMGHGHTKVFFINERNASELLAEIT
jgi:hypothetical protein